jgi:hypothetical protein
VLVLVVVLVLDGLGFCGEKEIPSVMILFDRSDGETDLEVEPAIAAQYARRAQDEKSYVWSFVQESHS